MARTKTVEPHAYRLAFTHVCPACAKRWTQGWYYGSAHPQTDPPKELPCDECLNREGEADEIERRYGEQV